MDNHSLAPIALLLYITLSAFQWCPHRVRSTARRTAIFLLGGLALWVHAMVLHGWIDVASGQNLTAFNMISLVFWVIGVLGLVLMLCQPLEMLLAFIFPMAAISIVLVLCYPHPVVINTAQSAWLLWHILLGVFSLSVMGIAGLQACLVLWQDRCLHARRDSLLLERLPPLETTERVLFLLVLCAFIVLTVALLIGFAGFSQGTALPVVMPKVVAASVSWLVLCGLLVGRYIKGWRGRQAVLATLCSTLLLFAAFALS